MRLTGTYRWKPYAEMPAELRDGRVVIVWCEGWPEAQPAVTELGRYHWFLLDDQCHMRCDPDFYCELPQPPRSTP